MPNTPPPVSGSARERDDVDQRLAKIRERLEKATAGPMRCELNVGKNVRYAVVSENDEDFALEVFGYSASEDLSFYANCESDVRFLLDHIAALTASPRVTDEVCDRIIGELNGIASDFDIYSYGLPVGATSGEHNEISVQDQMRDAIRAALETLPSTEPRADG